jgi:hypothetical protein
MDMSEVEIKGEFLSREKKVTKFVGLGFLVVIIYVAQYWLIDLNINPAIPFLLF